MADAIYRPDVVIVGGGVAGLTAALNLAPRKVCIITKSTLGVNTSSMWAQGGIAAAVGINDSVKSCLLYTSPSPRDRTRSRMPSSA